MRKKFGFLLFVFILFLSLTYKRESKISFLFGLYSNNTITSTKSLVEERKHLRELRLKKDSVYSIFHVGDSHIEMGHFTNEIHQNLAKKHGFGPCGWMFPYQFFQTYSEVFYPMKLSGNWERTLVKKLHKEFPLGVSGEEFHLLGDTGAIEIYKTIRHGKVKNLEILHFLDVKTIFNLSVSGATVTTTSISKHTGITKIEWKEAQDSVVIDCSSLKGIPMYAFRYNVTLKGGVSMSRFGVGGATLGQFLLHTPLFVEQIKALRPNMLLLSLGTNDSYVDTIQEIWLKEKLDSFVTLLRKEVPETQILITTAPDTRYKNNFPPSLFIVNNVLKEVAQKHSLILWDLFTIMGGDTSIYTWKKYKLGHKDQIHFTPKGYRLQGDLFVKAFLRD
jgi:lysophospholipase L1-like esterase